MISKVAWKLLAIRIVKLSLIHNMKRLYLSPDLNCREGSLVEATLVKEVVQVARLALEVEVSVHPLFRGKLSG